MNPDDLTNSLDFSPDAESFLGDETNPFVFPEGSAANSVALPASGTSPSSPSPATSSGGVISSIIQALGGGSSLTALENAGILGTDIFGTIGNIGLSQSEGNLMNEALGLASNYSSLTPTQVASMINRYMASLSGAPGSSLSFPQALNYFEQPLGQNLTQGIESQVNESLAAQGLAQSPGIMNAVTTEALAPYMLQEQNAAEGLYSNLLSQSSSDLFNQLNLPLSAIGAVRFPPPSPISPLINPATSALSGVAGTVAGPLAKSLGLGGGSSGAGGAVSSIGDFLESPAGSLIGGALSGGLLGATEPGLGGAIQPGALGALEGAGLGAGISAAATPIAADLGADLTESLGEGALSALGPGLSGALSSVIGAAVPFVGPLLALIPFLFQGANPEQVGPAKAQQPFEVGADDVYNAVKAGYLTPAQGDQAIAAIGSSANSQLTSLVNSIMASGGGNQKIAATPAEVAQNLSNIMNSINSLPAESPAPFNAADFSSILMNPSTAGYYPGQVASGNEIAQNLINGILGAAA